MAGPLEQFEIKPIVPIDVGGLDLSFTNASLWMVFAAGAASALMYFSVHSRSLVPGRWQSASEMLYDTVSGMLRESTGPDGRQYFPFIFSIFAFILFGNLLGMIPGSFTFTSHIIVTFGLAAVIWLGCTVIGFMKHGSGYLRLFFPAGAPLWTAVILVPIELISYLSRPVSLAVRLFANMTVGHLMLKVVAGFVVPLGFVFGIVPILGLVAITALEFLIAVIQAYVFAILSCIYLSDALHPHH